MSIIQPKQCENCKQDIPISPYYEHRPKHYYARQFCGRSCQRGKHWGSVRHPHFYSVWKNMRVRCYTPTNQAYSNYGGRGIRVCDRWKDFTNFLEDMQDTYEEGLTLDRINNNGDYAPNNCRWVTKADQNRNTRKNRLITIKGDTRILAEWIRLSGLKPATVSMRLHYGWPVKKALGM